MTMFRDARGALQEELGPILGAPVHVGWPTEIEPPLAFMLPPLGGPYVRRGPHFSEVTIAVDLVLAVGHGDANSSLRELEPMIEAVVYNLHSWVLGEIDAPEPMAIADSGANYLAAIVHLTKPVRIELS
jgi:hypothetical protein